jgi:hypothetical protein
MTRPTRVVAKQVTATVAISGPTAATELKRRTLKLKAKFESSPSYPSFKRLVPASRRFQLGFHWVNLHRLTSAIAAATSEDAAVCTAPRRVRDTTRAADSPCTRELLRRGVG